jgi:Domain of unknown function (DUF4123)
MNPPEQIEAARPGLAAPLFGKGDVPVFAVLDGASVRGLVKKIFEHEPEYCCLYRGELEPDTATVAPYLVRLEADSPFTEWVLRDGWGVHWGVFIVSAANLRTLRNHFREFLRVELPDRRTVLFRYYDPRVFRSFVPACNAAELGKFFGPVQSFVVEGETPEAGVKYSLAGNALKLEPFQLKKTPAAPRPVA